MSVFHTSRFTYLVVLLTSVLGGVASSPASAQSGGVKPPVKAEKADAKAPPAADKIALVHKAQAGQIRRGKAQATLNITDPAGAKHVIEIKEIGRTKYVSVSASGDISYEDTVESSETTLDGHKDPTEEKKETNTTTIHPNGVLVSYKNSDSDKDKEKFASRLYNATTPIFAAKPVGVGDKWAFDFKSDDTLGTRNGHADYEITGGDAETLKINFSYLESGDKGISAKGFFVIEKISGDKVSEDYKIENVPLGEEDDITYASGSANSQRTEGGPIANPKNAPIVEKKDKTIEEAVKDFEKLPGFLTLYRKKDAGRDTIYAEVREDQLGKLMFLQTTASTGNGEEVIAGDPISDIVFKLTKLQDDRLVITIPNWYYQADLKTPMGKAVRRAFPEGFLQTFKIEARQPDRKSVLIDLSDFFRGDFAQISQALNGGAGGGGGFLPGSMPGSMYSLDREKTYIASVKSFPENVVVYTQYHFMRGGRGTASALADSRSLPLTIVYNLFALPNDAETYKPTNGFQPRKADGRIGYFTTEFMNFDDDSKEDPTVRYIYRWDIKKKDPNAAMSEPVKPIVFYLDNAIPLEYRDAVKKGVLNWNKGFEKIGIKNALEVKQMPDDADWDHADGRYNIVRWVVTPDDSPRFTVAIALTRINPLTGQILSASVSVDAGWARYGKLERRRLIEPAAAFAKGAEIGTDILTEAKERGENVDDVVSRLQRGAMRCEIGGEGLYQKAWMGDLSRRMLRDGDNPVAEKAYTNQLMVETVTHEMGHIMGLRHNFIASTEFTLEQLKNPALVAEHGIGASVMDYNNFNISAVKAKGVDFYSQTIGDYDIWAIDYGYRNFANPQEEASRLKDIASLSNLPGHKYQSDEEAIVGIDPRVTRFDMSAQTLDYWEKMLQMSRYLMLNLGQREPKRGESYWEFTKNLNGLMGTYANAAGVASRHIGGVELNRNYRGDANEKPTLLPVAPAKQKQALRMLNAYIFAPDALSLPTSYYDHLTGDPFGFNLSPDFPIADQIAAVKRNALTRLFSTGVLRRISNAEYKEKGDATQTLTLPELYSSVTASVWAELPQKKNIPSQRRQLQRVYVDTMTDMIIKPSSVPDDAKMLSRETLRDLRTAILTAKANPALDTYSKLHLSDCLGKIDRALNAQLTIGSSGGGAPTSLLQMLLGGKQ